MPARIFPVGRHILSITAPPIRNSATRKGISTFTLQCSLAAPRIQTIQSNGSHRNFATSTADGTRGFFEWLEKTYGARFGGRSLPMDDAKNTAMICKDSLELEDLERLFRHEISVLKVRNFFPTRASLELGKKLAREGETTRAQNWKVSTSRGLESSDVFTVGRHAPYNIAIANHAQDEYFREVRKELRDRRGLAVMENENEANNTTQRLPNSPQLWPLDLLRLELDELWSSGAGLARANHEATNANCMGGGLPRLMVGPTRWKKGLVHVDELAPLDDTKGCFSANIYLQLPYEIEGNGSDDDENERKEQPVMEVWPLGIRSKWDWYRNAPTLSHLASQDPEGQVILRKTLGDERKVKVCAAPGDLVLLCVQRPHCAIGFGHDAHENNNGKLRRLQTRVSLQCFLQYSGENERLTIDS